ncbi:MAG: PilZ domain-containing protein, partial [Gammaproteobacteria bacterium]
PRIQEKSYVYNRVRSSTEALDLVGRIFSCHSSDVSLEGIKMHIDIELPIGALLELEIVFKDSPGRFLQIGDVIWCDGFVDESLEGCWYDVGVKFKTVTNPWKRAVSKLLEPEKEAG